MEEGLPAAERLLAQVGVRVPLSQRASRTKLAAQWVQAKLRGLEHVARAAADIPPAALRTTDALYSIASGLAFTDPMLGRVVQGELLRAALDAGDPVRVCLALAQEVCYAARAGSRNRAAIDAVGARLEAVARDVGEPHVVGFARTALGIAAFLTGRWRDAHAQLEPGLAALRAHRPRSTAPDTVGLRWELSAGDACWLSTLYFLGAWRELPRLADDLLRDAIERGDVAAQLALRNGPCTRAWLVRGRPDEARAQLEIAARGLGDGFYLPHAQAVIAAATIDLYAGDAALAGHRLRDAWVQLEKLGLGRLQHLRLELAHLRARIALADHQRPVADRVREARGHAAELIDEGAGWAEPLGQLILAACRAWEGERAAAAAELARAEPGLAVHGMAGFAEVARLYRTRLAGTDNRNSLIDLGALDPDAVAAHLVPWPW
jgi:hypothetical protein